MAEHETEKETAAQDSDRTPARRRVAAPDSVGGADRFEVADLIARAPDFLSLPSHVVAGGLHGQTEPITLDEARSRVDTWLNEPVTEEA